MGGRQHTRVELCMGHAWGRESGRRLSTGCVWRAHVEGVESREKRMESAWKVRGKRMGNAWSVHGERAEDASRGCKRGTRHTSAWRAELLHIQQTWPYSRHSTACARRQHARANSMRPPTACTRQQHAPANHMQPPTACARQQHAPANSMRPPTACAPPQHSPANSMRRPTARAQACAHAAIQACINISVCAGACGRSRIHSRRMRACTHPQPAHAGVHASTAGACGRARIHSCA
eukprot:365973-Chlamydomonas_euryale.AAC.17